LKLFELAGLLDFGQGRNFPWMIPMVIRKAHHQPQ
jgi:hypothetical protein